VASTRVVLLEGHTGPDAAGKVIEAFGHFLVGGNYAVGIVVFVILVVINFVVITKGAGRIAEVSARFTLDAMPGKQMAIDADLNAGLIGEDEARKRRTDVAQEADFYGSMDGASKFVRGDAVAGIIILAHQHHRRPHRRHPPARSGGFATAANNYTLLTIGDGLVAQIPALIISTAAGIVVSRVGERAGHGEQIIGQVFGNPQIAVADRRHPRCARPDSRHAAHSVFLLLAGGLGGAGYWLLQRRRQAEGSRPPRSRRRQPPEEARGGELGTMSRRWTCWAWRSAIAWCPWSTSIRTASCCVGFAACARSSPRIGFLCRAGAYPRQPRIEAQRLSHHAQGRPSVEGEAVAGKLPGHQSRPGQLGTLSGRPTKDPAFGLPAVWIDAACATRPRPTATRWWMPARWSPPTSTKIINEHAPELLGGRRPSNCSTISPSSARNWSKTWCPSSCRWPPCSGYCRTCWKSRSASATCAPSWNTLAEHSARTQDADELTAAARTALGRAIIHETFGGAQELQVMALEPNLEHILMQALASRGDTGVGLEPGLAERLVRETVQAVERQESAGLPAVLLSPPAIRPVLARFLRRSAPGLKVLSHAEVPDGKTIRIVSLIGGG
jgi:flagellar biosynthesis protein FlhA